MQPWKEEFVRQRIRAMLDSGEMPCDQPEKLWAGRGTGSHCAACGETISSTEIEYEVQLASTTLRLHRVCHTLWHDECQPRSPLASAPA